MSTAIDEIKAQIATKEAEMSRIDDELVVLRKALAILSGRRTIPVATDSSQVEPKIPDLIKAVLQESDKSALSNDELVSKVRAKGSQATRETILGTAYRMAKYPNGLIKG